MRTIVVGLGVQGHKRRQCAGEDCVATVDPENAVADYRHVSDVPLASYDAALCCVPDEPKLELLSYLLDNGKHVLCEKPLWVPDIQQLDALEDAARARRVVCYTAYNHRFEPHFVRMRKLIESGELGALYRCRMFYGNGTARLVRGSAWRDHGAGVLPDLGSHLLDTATLWFGPLDDNGLQVRSCNRFENLAPDHVVVSRERGVPQLELEMTLLSWRNHFTCDIFAERGSAHIASLCKWGPSRFTHFTRVLPAGRPPEHTEIVTQPDPTWTAEYTHFKHLCASGAATDLSHDRWLLSVLDRLARQAAQAEVPRA